MSFYTLDLKGENPKEYEATATCAGKTCTAPGVSPFDAYVAALAPLIPFAEGIQKHELERIVFNMQDGCLATINKNRISEAKLIQSYKALTAA